MRTEVIDTRSRPVALGAFRVERVVDYLFGLLYSILLIRLVLEFFGARQGTGVVGFIDRITDPFYAPFRGIFPPSNLEGGHLVWALVAAILGYMLLHAAIRGAIHLIGRPAASL